MNTKVILIENLQGYQSHEIHPWATLRDFRPMLSLSLPKDGNVCSWIPLQFWGPSWLHFQFPFTRSLAVSIIVRPWLASSLMITNPSPLLPPVTTTIVAFVHNDLELNSPNTLSIKKKKEKKKNIQCRVIRHEFEPVGPTIPLVQGGVYYLPRGGWALVCKNIWNKVKE